MLEKYKNDPSKRLKIIKSKKLTEEDKPVLYELLTDKNVSDEEKFLIWKAIKQKNDLLDVEKLSELLNMPALNIKKIFTSTPIEVKFPIALKDKAEITKAYIIELPKETDTLSFSSKEEKIEALKTIKDIVNKPFFVIFEKDFTHKSFMLAVLVGLLTKGENIDKFAFTGVVNKEGEIFSVDGIEEKEKVAKEQGLKLIKPDYADTIDELLYWIGEEAIDIPFLIMVNKSTEEAKTALTKLEKEIKDKKPYFSIEKLKNIFDIQEEDLYLYYDKPLSEKEEEWQNLIKLFEEKLKNIYSKFENKIRILHIAFATPASLAMGFGIKLGTKKPVILYHYQSDKYVPVIDLSSAETIRIVKGMKEIEKIKYEIKNIQNTEDVAVEIRLASHNLTSDVENYLKANNKDYAIVNIQTLNAGNLPLPEKNEWAEYISEIYTLLNDLKNQYHINRYHIFLSTPVAIAFALGMAIGHFWDTYIYNYNPKAEIKNKYFKVLEGKNLESIF